MFLLRPNDFFQIGQSRVFPIVPGLVFSVRFSLVIVVLLWSDGVVFGLEVVAEDDDHE